MIGYISDSSPRAAPAHQQREQAIQRVPGDQRQVVKMASRSGEMLHAIFIRIWADR